MFTPQLLDASPKVLRQFRAGSLPIQATAIVPTLLGDQHQVVPAVLLRTGRRDLRDLARVHAAEGSGAARTTWDALLAPDGSGLVRLRVAFQEPVTCRFIVVFDLPQHAAFLSAVAAAGRLSFSADRMSPFGVTVETTTHELAHWLVLHSITRALRQHGGAA